MDIYAKHAVDRHLHIVIEGFGARTVTVGVTDTLGWRGIKLYIHITALTQFRIGIMEGVANALEQTHTVAI